MRRILILLFLLPVVTSQVQAQCSAVPVEEAVVNGDFEDGYLTGPVSGFPFFSDYTFGGQYNPNAGCGVRYYTFGNRFGVGRRENRACAEGGGFRAGNPYAGGYVNGAWRDHTTGTGAGFGMIVDVLTILPANNSLQNSPVIWGQRVSILF